MKTVITYENRKHNGISPTRKMELVKELMNTNAQVISGQCTFGTVTPDGNVGTIEKVAPGVWGYGGDSIAVYINGKPYPSRSIIELNVEADENTKN